MTIDRALLDGLARAAVAGGTEVLAVYRTEFAVDAKGDASPVTEADRRAEAVILAQLADLMPGVPVVAEEARGSIALRNRLLSSAVGRLKALGQAALLEAR